MFFCSSVHIPSNSISHWIFRNIEVKECHHSVTTWQSMPKNQTCKMRPTFATWEQHCMTTYRIIKNANAHGIFQNHAFLYTQPILGLPRFAPGIRLRRCETEGSLDLTVETCWNVLTKLMNFRENLSEISLVHWERRLLESKPGAFKIESCIIPEQFAVEIQIFIIHNTYYICIYHI